MKITYIYHSGFLVESADAYYIFDYYRADFPVTDADKPVYVFVSHRHPDHYNPYVFEILREKKVRRMTGIISYDIKPRNYTSHMEGVEIIAAEPDKEYTLDNGARVRTLRSTDKGVAYVVTFDDGGVTRSVYHAGDLNDWVWDGEDERMNKWMTGSYRRYLMPVEGMHFDAVMVPVDSRQGDDMFRGIEYLLEKVKADAVYPMHYWDKPEVIMQFAGKYPQYADIIRYTEDRMDRYSVIEDKNPREIVLLRGSGCVYKKCTFCDYYSDSGKDEDVNYMINRAALSQVTGKYGNIEIINSGSVFELDKRTIELIKKRCAECMIHTIHFEAHYLYNNRIEDLRREFADFELKMKLGLESFDYDFREKILHKGIPEKDPEVISRNFDEANFLFGIRGQTEDGMRKDIELGLANFERICINIMCANSTGIKPCKSVIKKFVRNIYPEYKDNERVDILINNTDFGVGD